MNFNELLKKLNAKKTGNGWKAKCPAHNDHNASLSIAVSKTGRIMIHCFAGCEYRAIMDTLKTGKIKHEIMPLAYRRRIRRQMDFERIWRTCRSQDSGQACRLKWLAASIGISAEAIDYLEPAWDNSSKGWLFPMFGADGKMCGLRVRGYDGAKWAVTGSRNGVFFNERARNLFGDVMAICEGVTDTIAAMQLGFFAVGLPSAQSGVDIAAAIVNRYHPERVVIFPDQDAAGQISGEKVKAMLPQATICNLPAKDVREFLQQGGTRAFIDQQINNQQPMEN